jgi:assimilatory nitrate reductase catalytic subunit
VSQSSSGTDKVNAIINCHLATGRIGRAGMGPFSVTGQPNAMGGREVGGLSNQLAAHMGFDRPADVDRVARFWSAPAMASRPGLKAVDMFDAILDGRIRAVWILATNPAASLPRADRVRRALDACPLVVVSDCWDTDTTARAHVVLPAAAWGEKDGTVTNSERRISRQRRFRDAPGEARPDWWMLTEVARRLGFGAAFPYQGPAEIFREHAALSAFENDGGRVFDIGALSDLSDADYDRLEPVQWPLRGLEKTKPSLNPSFPRKRESMVPQVLADGWVPAGACPPAGPWPDPGAAMTKKGGEGRLFGDGNFATADGRARFIPTLHRPPVARPDRRHRFILNTGRLRDQWHTMTRTGLAPRLMTHQDEPHLDLHPADAAGLGVAEGDLLRVETDHGAAILRARPSDAIRRGEAFLPMHWTDRFTSAGPAARLVNAACDPISGQPEMKATPARLAPVPTLWRGLLIARAPAAPPGEFYWTRTPLAGGGHAFTLRGWDRLPEPGGLSDWAGTLLGSASGEGRATLIDSARGIFRFARIADGTLESCLFLTLRDRFPLPGRADMAALLGGRFDDEMRRALFAVAESAISTPAPSRIVCVCHGVGQAAIEEAITRHRLATTAQIGAMLRAGTNCGSCLPELKEILRDAHAPA